MAEEYKEKTAFYTGEGVFFYKKILFSLKNAGATYQRLVDKVFSHQIGRNLKAYIDNMVIKSTSEKEMLKDIQETFERFRSINMKLNSKKCSFGVEEGPFLGHLITKQEIKANPSKVKAVTDLDQPRTLKDIQSLNGKLAALSRFYRKVRKDPWLYSKYSKGSKKKEHTMDTQSRQSTGENKETRSSLTNTHCTKGGRNSNNAPHRLKKSITVVLAVKIDEG
ncbi:reverse transcriptase domain-containing protein [Tanacetum coccineum]